MGGQILSVPVSDGSKHRRRNQQGGVCVCVDSPEGDHCSGGVGDGGILRGRNLDRHAHLRAPEQTCADQQNHSGRDEQLNISGQLDQFITFLFLVATGISGNFSPGVCQAVCWREVPLLTHALMTLLGEAVIHTIEMLLGNTNLTVPSPCLSEAIPG